MLARQAQRMTAEEFVDAFEGAEGKWELIGGEPRMMAGGSAAHSRVAVNLLAALVSKLRGSGRAPFNSDMGLRVSKFRVMYPDVTVYCDARDLGLDQLKTQLFEHPAIVFEILSPSTARSDRTRKVREYQAIASLRLIVLIDPDARAFETYERLGPEEWRVGLFPPGASLDVLDPAFTITAEEMFEGL